MSQEPEPPLPSRELADLFAQARKEIGTPEEVARLADRLGPVLDAPVGTTSLSLAAKWVGAATLVVGGSLAVLVLVRNGENRVAPPSAPAQQPSIVATEAPADKATGSPLVAATSVERPVTREPLPLASTTAPRMNPVLPRAKGEAADPPTADPMVVEHALLAEARQSLASNPSRTLDLVAEHERRFPSGSLVSEREFLRVSALARLGRVEEARAARERFVATWPTSPYRDAVERLAQ
jgi:hypothetical protein